jgi:hypothetical protein
VAEKELNLLQFASVDMTQLCTCPSQGPSCQIATFPSVLTVAFLEASIGQKVDARRETEVSHKLIAA